MLACSDVRYAHMCSSGTRARGFVGCCLSEGCLFVKVRVVYL